MFSLAAASSSSSASSALISSHLAVISLQLVTGAWQLSKELAALCYVRLDELESALPPALAPFAEKKQIWATALAVALLQKRHRSAEDEWELVADKATLWMKGQLLTSASCSVDDLLVAAKGQGVCLCLSAARLILITVAVHRHLKSRTYTHVGHTQTDTYTHARDFWFVNTQEGQTHSCQGSKNFAAGSLTTIFFLQSVIMDYRNSVCLALIFALVLLFSFLLPEHFEA